jgi:uncharacterized membrane protein
MYTFLLVVHFVALALGVGTGFAVLRLARSVRDLPPPEKGPLMQKFSVLRLNGYTGLALLILSGLGMVVMRPDLFSAGGGAFHAKLSLVVAMVAVVGVMQTLTLKWKKAGGPPPAILPKLGNLNFTLGLLVILLAVLAFH